MADQNSCVFLDRDGVLNVDRPSYAYRIEHFNIIEGVPEALARLKKAGNLLIVVTNQSGISQGIYTQQEMETCHQFLQEKCLGLIDHFYFSPYHPKVTESLSRKPGSLLFEKAIAKFSIDTGRSWMIGDRGRDLVPAKKLGIKTIQIGNEVESENRGDYEVRNLTEAAEVVLTAKAQ
ncbi:MAG: HAD-IIIA family hydrolase [Cyclobacteriaceae bacterium]